MSWAGTPSPLRRATRPARCLTTAGPRPARLQACSPREQRGALGGGAARAACAGCTARPRPADLTARRPWLRAGQRGRGGSQQGGGRGWTERPTAPESPRPARGPRPPTRGRRPRSRTPAPRPQTHSAPGPLGPRTPPPHARRPAPGRLAARAPPPVAVHAPGAPRTWPAPRFRREVPSGSLFLLGACRAPPEAPARPAQRTALAANWAPSGAGRTLARERLARAAVHRPAVARPHAAGSFRRKRGPAARGPERPPLLLCHGGAAAAPGGGAGIGGAGGGRWTPARGLGRLRSARRGVAGSLSVQDARSRDVGETVTGVAGRAS